MAFYTLQVWDLFFHGSELRLRLHRYTSDTPMAAPFDATVCPKEHHPVGNGVVFLRNLEKCRVDPIEENLVREMGPNSYWRSEVRQNGNLVIAVTLPPGHVIPSISGVFPEPTTFKVFDGRLAFLWEIDEAQPRLHWILSSASPDSIDVQCGNLNRELLESARGNVAVAATLEVWKMSFKGSGLAIALDRYTSTHRIEANFDAVECPDRHRPVGDSIAFVRDLDHCRQYPHERGFAMNVNGRLECRRAKAWTSGELTVIAELPPGYAIPAVTAVHPLPMGFKIFEGKLVIHWVTSRDQPVFHWKLVSVNSALLETACEKLNRELLEIGGIVIGPEQLQLEPREIKVLEYLRDQENDEAPTQRMIGRKIGEEEDTVGILCRRLQNELHLIHRPHGQRKGYRLTPEGHKFLGRDPSA